MATVNTDKKIPEARYFMDLDLVDAGARLFASTNVVTQVPKCSDVELKLALQKRMRDFCTQTLSLEIDLLAEDIIADQNDYEFLIIDDSDECFEIEHLVKVLVDRVEMVPMKDYIIPNPGKLFFYAPPGLAITGGLEMRAAIKPRVGTSDMDRVFFDEWYEAFEHGVIYTMLQMNNKPWSNPTLANFHKSEWDRLITDAIVDRQLDGTNGIPTARFKNWTGTSAGRGRAGRLSA